MTKIVYNACFGGFGLSNEAIQRYSELKGLNLVFVKDEDYPNHGRWCRDGNADYDYYFDQYSIDRTDPALVQVVEELGERASDRYSDLQIADLEPGTRYYIDEYDGQETIMTVDSIDWSIA